MVCGFPVRGTEPRLCYGVVFTSTDEFRWCFPFFTIWRNFCGISAVFSLMSCLSYDYTSVLNPGAVTHHTLYAF